MTPGAYDTALDLTFCNSTLCGDGYVVKIATGYTSITGRVTAALGQPLANVPVKANALQTTSTAAGYYTFTQLLPGTYTVTVSADYFWLPAQRVINAPPITSHSQFIRSGVNVFAVDTDI